MRTLVGPENDYSEILGLPDPQPALRVAVVMPVYNRVDLLARTVAGLVAQNYPRELLSVVVADDGSDEDVAAAISPFMERLDLRLVRRDHEGYGAGQARNLGAAAADADVLVFIDADCVPDRDLVVRHARWHHFADNLVVIGSRHGVDTSALSADSLASGTADLRYLAFGTSAPDDAAFRPTDNRAVLHRRTAGQRTGTEAFRSLVSSNFSIRSDTFSASGGFSSDFHRWGGEDIELGWRLWNDGMFFVPDDRAACYHQLQDDTLGAEGRSAARDLNAGIISAKIPHRFYRKEVHGPIYEVPKVSWIITPCDDRLDHGVFDRLIRHRYLDTEVIFAAPGPATTLLGEAYGGDPRFNVAAATDDDPTGVGAAIRASRGEYVAVVHGRATVDRRLLTRTLHGYQAAPRVARVSVGYRIGTGESRRDYRNRRDVARLDAAWTSGGLPVFSLAPRREWIKAVRATADIGAAWDLLRRQTLSRHLPDELVALPAESPDLDPGPLVTAFDSDRSLLTFDLRGAATFRSVATALARFGIARLTRRPYRSESQTESETAGSAIPSPAPAQPAPAPNDGGAVKPKIRYVGWNGHDNLGDDAMLEAVRSLFSWADVATARRGKLLMLGGGTLINRANYLEWLVRQDSPRMERAVFGTGVANPEYWGQRESAEEWVRFLDSCSYVGLRGPKSLRTIRDWGFTGDAEVVGDPALLLTLGDTVRERRADRVVVTPAWTSGELWGKNDRTVLGALADMIQRLLAEGREVVMLSCFPGDDRHILEMMRAADAPDLPYMAGYDDLPAALELLASAGLVVAERLHGAVLAAAVNTPFLAIEYRPKVTDFAASLGLERLVLRSDSVTAASLGDLIAEIEADLAGVAEEMEVSVVRYRDRLHTASKRLEAVLG
jgi:glycosyltransferase involved in cell wall biosynthesis